MDVRERNIAVLKHLLIWDEFMFEVRRSCRAMAQDDAHQYIYNEVFKINKPSCLIDGGVSWYRSRMGNDYWRKIYENFSRVEYELEIKGKDITYENIISEYGRQD